jgi:hypothetical protein
MLSDNVNIPFFMIKFNVYYIDGQKQGMIISCKTIEKHNFYLEKW